MIVNIPPLKLEIENCLRVGRKSTFLQTSLAGFGQIKHPKHEDTLPYGLEVSG